MAVLDWMSADSGYAVEAERVRLRAPRMGDFLAWSTLRQGSQGFLQPWEPTWPSDDLTRAAFRRRGVAERREACSIDLGRATFRPVSHNCGEPSGQRPPMGALAYSASERTSVYASAVFVVGSAVREPTTR